MKKKLAALLLTLVMALTATIAVYATRPTGGGGGVENGTILHFDTEEEIQAYIASFVESNGLVVLEEKTTVDKDGNVTTMKGYGPEGH